MNHAGLDQLRHELQYAEHTLRRIMEDTDLLTKLGHGTVTFAGIWKDIKSAQATIDFLRHTLSLSS